MAKTYTHTCDCGSRYKSDDPDPYRCPECVERTKAIAAEIDSKPRQRSEHMSGIQLYDSLPKFRGFVSANDIM